MASDHMPDAMTAACFNVPEQFVPETSPLMQTWHEMPRLGGGYNLSQPVPLAGTSHLLAYAESVARTAGFAGGVALAVALFCVLLSCVCRQCRCCASRQCCVGGYAAAAQTVMLLAIAALAVSTSIMADIPTSASIKYVGEQIGDVVQSVNQGKLSVKEIAIDIDEGALYIKRMAGNATLCPVGASSVQRLKQLFHAGARTFGKVCCSWYGWCWVVLPHVDVPACQPACS